MEGGREGEPGCCKGGARLAAPYAMSYRTSHSTIRYISIGRRIADAKPDSGEGYAMSVPVTA
eukprot:2037106-Rhodomonas_salina.3